MKDQNQKDQIQKDQKDFLDLRFIYFVIFYCKKLVDFKLNTLSMFLILVSMRQEEKEEKSENFDTCRTKNLNIIDLYDNCIYTTSLITAFEQKC